MLPSEALTMEIRHVEEARFPAFPDKLRPMIKHVMEDPTEGIRVFPIYGTLERPVIGQVAVADFPGDDALERIIDMVRSGFKWPTEVIGAAFEFVAGRHLKFEEAVMVADSILAGQIKRITNSDMNEDEKRAEIRGLEMSFDLAMNIIPFQYLPAEAKADGAIATFVLRDGSMGLLDYDSFRDDLSYEDDYTVGEDESIDSMNEFMMDWLAGRVPQLDRGE